MLKHNKKQLTRNTHGHRQRRKDKWVKWDLCPPNSRAKSLSNNSYDSQLDTSIRLQVSLKVHSFHNKYNKQTFV